MNKQIWRYDIKTPYLNNVGMHPERDVKQHRDKWANIPCYRNKDSLLWTEVFVNDLLYRLCIVEKYRHEYQHIETSNMALYL